MMSLNPREKLPAGISLADLNLKIPVERESANRLHHCRCRGHVLRELYPRQCSRDGPGGARMGCFTPAALHSNSSGRRGSFDGSGFLRRDQCLPSAENSAFPAYSRVSGSVVGQSEIDPARLFKGDVSERCRSRRDDSLHGERGARLSAERGRAPCPLVEGSGET